ncbi:MAG: YncE family protein [Bryobacteraceae bacterium]|nr:YncE family protein [Bryobacteraceae bacterium]
MFLTLRFAAAFFTVAAYGADLPSPALLVLNKEEATLAIVDPATGKVTGRIGTGLGPHEVVVDGRTAYVTNYGSRPPGTSLSIVDLVAQKEKRFDVSPLQRPHGIAVSGGKIWFTAEGSKLVARYDPATGKLDTLLGTGQNSTHMVELSKDGSEIYAANISSNSISIFSGPPAMNQTVIAVGKGPEGFDVSADGKELWCANSQDGTVSIIDLKNKQLIETFDVGTKRSNRLKLTLDRKLALISDLAAGDLVVLDVATRKVVKRLAVGKAPEGILMDPSGTRAFVAVSGDNHVAIFDLQTLTVTGRLETGKGPDGMAWVR